jgi:hypothetical protein
LPYDSDPSNRIIEKEGYFFVAHNQPLMKLLNANGLDDAFLRGICKLLYSPDSGLQGFLYMLHPVMFQILIADSQKLIEYVNLIQMGAGFLGNNGEENAKDINWIVGEEKDPKIFIYKDVLKLLRTMSNAHDNKTKTCYETRRNSFIILTQSSTIETNREAAPAVIFFLCLLCF